jgi:toxin-antitoxin system PIN domain toxin
VIAVDTNILVYALREDSPFHAPSLNVLTDLAVSGRRWGIPWSCVHEFISISTHPKVYRPPTPLETALASIRVWLETRSCETLSEGPGYFEILTALATKAKLAGPMVHDARIAALCLYHGVSELWTADRDFSRFPELKTRNPLL